MSYIISTIFVIFFVSCGQNTGVAPSEISSSSSNKKIFITASTSLGDFGGPVMADATCMSDSNKPSDGSTYKAMTVLSGVRTACSTANCSGGISEHLDWVVKPNTQYVKTDGAIIGTSDSKGLFTDTLTNSIGVNNNEYVWTGLATDWTIDGYTCSSWTDTSGSLGHRGAVSQTDLINMVSPGLSVLCSFAMNFYCVEQ